MDADLKTVYAEEPSEGQTHALFQVGLKILLQRGEEFLVLILADSGFLDLPGGRIDAGEQAISLQEILAREIREELGTDVKYILGSPLFNYRRGFHRTVPVFTVVYEADYISGEIMLSPEHSSYTWAHPKTFVCREKDFPSLEAYAAFKKYVISFEH